MAGRCSFFHAAIIAFVAAASPIASPALGQDAFYDAQPDELPGSPGTLIRQEPVAGAPAGAEAFRILYRSTGLKGEPIAISGLVVLPSGAPPASGRPMVAWAHPTSGTVRKCAPSLARRKFDQIQGLQQVLGLGYAVVATDYPGLGAGGVHPYLVGDSEGRAVVDSVRAARGMEGMGGDAYVVWGHSQGGQAALYTGLLSASYAPELKLLGVAAAAPATDLATLMRDDFSSMGGKNLTAMTLWSWAQVYGAPIQQVVSPEAMPTVDALANECIESLIDFLERQLTGRPLDKVFLTVPDVTVVEPWKSLMHDNTPGPLPDRMPVFLAQGDADTIVRPAVTETYRRALCKAGSPVRMMVLPGISHAGVAHDAASDAVDWMAARFAGQPAPSDC